MTTVMRLSKSLGGTQRQRISEIHSGTVGVANVVGAFGAECRLGGEVTAGFGEDVAPVAEGMVQVRRRSGEYSGRPPRLQQVGMRFGGVG